MTTGTGNPRRFISPVLDPSIFQCGKCRLEIVGGYGGAAQVLAHQDFGRGFEEAVNLGYCIKGGRFQLLGAFAKEEATTFVVARLSSRWGEGERRQDRAILVITVTGRNMEAGEVVSFSDYYEGSEKKFATEADSVRENPEGWVAAHPTRYEA